MRLSKTIALLVIAGYLGAASAAVGQCSLSRQEIESSPVLRTYQANYLEALNRSWSEAPAELDPRLYAAHAGHLLGRQAQYVGTDAGREAIFACLRDHMAEDLIEGAIHGEATGFVPGASDPALIVQTFELALFGALDDQIYREAGIDVTRPVPSIFDSGWSGTWAIEAVSQSVHNFDLAVNVEVVEIANGATVTLSSPTRPGAPETFPAVIEGGTLRFQHPVGRQNTYSWALALTGDTCSGSLVSAGPSQSMTWSITRCDRLGQ